MELVLKPDSSDRPANDDWQIWPEQTQDTLPEDGYWLWPFSLWQTRREELIARAHPALWLNVDDDPAELAEQDFDRIVLIGIHFQQFADGRGLSLAVELRNKRQYRGELRALGYVLPDMLDYMRRCGFDSMLLRKPEDFAIAQQNLAVMDDYYQGSVIQPQPLFRRVVR